MPTVEELAAKVEALEKELQGEKKKVTDQNSYITKLEAQAKAGNTSPQQSATAANDPVVQRYLEEKMREDTLSKAYVIIKQEVSEDIFKVIEPDLEAFLNKNMTKQNTTVAFVTDAFSLILGKAYRNKEHAIHKIGKGGTPTATPNQTNAVNVQNVQQSLRQTPPVITGQDGTSGGLPSTEVKVVNTKDAFKALRERFNQSGGNKFQ